MNAPTPRPGAADATLREPVPQPLAWWRLPIVWLTLGLPLLVVLASLCTAGIAWRYADAVVVDPPPKRANAAHVPAEQARNHAAMPAR